MAGKASKQGTKSGSDPRTEVRRKDREIFEREQLSALLERAQIGYIATSVGDQPYLNPNLFWYDRNTHRLYFHTARTGRTRTNIESNKNVCFCIAEMGELLPADTALEFSTEYASVIVFGRAELLGSEQRQRYALQGLLDKYFPSLSPGEDYRGITGEELDRTSVFSISIDSWSGKEKRA